MGLPIGCRFFAGEVVMKIGSASIRWFGVVAYACFWLLGGVCCPAAETRPPVKNVIVLIPDGCGAEHFTLARWYRGRSLALDGILVGAVQTHIADSVVADSAPAATAFATGQRTSDKVIGMGPKRATLPGVPQPGPELQYRPLATVLEGARLSGKATGVIATSRVSHATPAAYAAHVPSRSLENEIMEQLVYQGVDVVLGGGRDQLLPLSAQGKRADGEDLRQVLKQSGYQLPETREALAEVKPGKVFGMFASGPLSPELDRPQLRPQEPTLAEMTAKAIELLTANPHGFFLVVEGSQIDWACHANDPAHLISDLLAFDDAVRVALDFAKRDGQTLLLAVPDHNTGGLTIGNFRTDATYSQMQIGDLLDPLRQMRRSSSGIWDQLCGGREREAVKAESIDPRDVQRVVLEHWSVTIDLEEAREILALAAPLPPALAHWGVGRVVSRKATVIGWSTHGHTGGDVPLFAFGPGRPVGLIDGPRVGTLTAEALGLDLAALNERLFVDAREALASATLDVVEASPGNLVVKVALGDRTAELPVHKNLLLMDGQEIELEGLVVCAPPIEPQTEPRIFLPLQAVQRILGRSEPLPRVQLSKPH
jgi:alkaline phosphatase